MNPWGLIKPHCRAQPSPSELCRESGGSCQQGKAQNRVIHPCLLLLSPAALPVLLQAPEPRLKLALSWALSLTPCSLPVSKASREKPISLCCSWEPPLSLGVRSLVLPPPHSSTVSGALRNRLAWGRGDAWGLEGQWKDREGGRSPRGDPRRGPGKGTLGVLEPSVPSALLSQFSPPKPAVSPQHCKGSWSGWAGAVGVPGVLGSLRSPSGLQTATGLNSWL